MSHAETELIRIRQEEETQALAQGAPCEPGSTSWVGKTVTVTTYPTSASAFYAVQREAVSGSEVEGGAATVGNAGGIDLVYNIGASIPAVNTLVLVTSVPNRLVMQYG